VARDAHVSAIDERLVKALHVHTLRKSELHAEHDPHLLFQTSTIDALLDGAYDGDVTFAELAEHGDFGLGTFDACDGEMIAVDGSFLRADVDGHLHPVAPQQLSPFAVLTFFSPTRSFEIEGPLEGDELLAALDERLGQPEAAHAVRVEGAFERVHARSVARQAKPYRPLTEVVADQHVFELTGTGTMVGFRFPDYAAGLNVPGYHLHFISEDRTRGGHVLSSAIGTVTVEVDDEVDLHLELPPGVELDSPGAISEDALRRVERDG
jgi:acetolactate decarboxylase